MFPGGIFMAKVETFTTWEAPAHGFFPSLQSAFLWKGSFAGGSVLKNVSMLFVFLFSWFYLVLLKVIFYFWPFLGAFCFFKVIFGGLLKQIQVMFNGCSIMLFALCLLDLLLAF